ncbi:MAG: GTPase [Gaiellales bacterium]|jgi:GTP-binding protein Era|nr:GTPase [Gaiellales bacterium]
MRSGFVGLAGRPNVGKSTLTNALAGAHVAIVSDKPQTTRQRALGVVHGDGFQIVLVDLPGFQKPFDALTRRMQRSVDTSLKDVDAVLLVLDASEVSGGGDRFIAQQLAATGAPVVIALNKVDRLQPPAILESIASVSGLVEDYVALHPVSARTGDGVEALKAELVALLPEGPAYFEEGVDSDQPLERRIGELIREQALARTREEVPHAIAVVVDEAKPPRGKRVGRVTATLIVEETSQQGILVGKDGATVRAIGTAARPEIERLLGGSIYLDLRVKVRRGWRRDDSLLERFGL